MNNEEIKHNFATNLVKLRKSKNLNQTELGNEINYSFKNISKWENEETIPDVCVLSAIAEYFGVTIDDLISNKDIVKKSNQKFNHIVITLSSCLLPYILALIIFFILHVLSIKEDFYSFIAGGIASSITAVVLTSIFYKKYAICGSIIYLIWMLAILVMFLINFNTFWLVIIIALALSLGLILFFSLKFHGNKKIK